MRRSAGRDKPAATKRKIRIDLSEVEGRRSVAPKGWHHVTVESVELTDGNKDQYLKWTFAAVEGKLKFFTNTSLSPQSLWNLRGLLECLGVDIPDGPMDIDFADCEDRELFIYVDHEEYDGRPRNRVVDYKSADSGEPDDAGEEEDSVAGEDNYSRSDLEAMSADELKAIAETEEIRLPKTKNVARLLEAVVDGLGSRVIDEEEAEAEEPEAEEAGEAETYLEEDIEGMDEAGLDEVVEASGIEVKKSKRLTVYRAAVLEALSEAGLIGSTGDEAEADTAETYSAEEIEEMGKEALDELCEKHSLEVPTTKSISRYRASVISALEEAELLTTEEEASTEGYTYDQVEEMDDDQLNELIKDHELEVKDGLKRSKLKSAVIAELEGRNLISE